MMSEEAYKASTTKKAIYTRIRWMAKDQGWKPSKSRKNCLWVWNFENTPKRTVKGLTNQQALKWLLSGMENPSTVDMAICGGDSNGLNNRLPIISI